MKKYIYEKLNLLLFFSIGMISGEMGWAWADEVPDPHQIRVTQVRAEGNGCSPGSYSVVLSPDAQSLTVLFDHFQAQSGGPSAPWVDRKFCNIDIDIEFPRDWMYTLIKADYRGFADLSAGSEGVHKVSYGFIPGQRGNGRGMFERGGHGNGSQGNFGRDFKVHLLRGPYSDNYITETTLPLDEKTPWRKCDGDEPMRIQTSITTQVDRRLAKTNAALMTLDSIDGRLEQRFGIAWRKCSRHGHH